MLDCNKGVQEKWYRVFYLKRAYILGFLPLSLIILVLVSSSEYIAEYVFARGIYRHVSSIVSHITGIIPYSIMEISIISLPFILIAYIIYQIVSIIRIRRSRQNIGIYFACKQLLNIFCIFSIVFFLFVIFAATNYYRYPFSKISGLDVRNSSSKELYEIMSKLSIEARDIRMELEAAGQIDEYGVVSINDKELERIGEIIQKDFINLSQEYDVFSQSYGRFKGVNHSTFMSRMEITGIYWPFTVEANVNVATTDFSIPAVIAHEMAHQRGFMREDEANFIAYLVSRNSENLLVQYSGIMLALSYGNNQLAKYDMALYNQVISNYNEGMILDIRDEYYYWKQFEDTVISTISNSMNDTYLKANKQEDGVKSYGRMVDLLLAYHR